MWITGFPIQILLHNYKVEQKKSLGNLYVLGCNSQITRAFGHFHAFSCVFHNYDV